MQNYRRYGEHARRYCYGRRPSPTATNYLTLYRNAFTRLQVPSCVNHLFIGRLRLYVLVHAGAPIDCTQCQLWICRCRRHLQQTLRSVRNELFPEIDLSIEKQRSFAYATNASVLRDLRGQQKIIINYSICGKVKCLRLWYDLPCGNFDGNH